MEHERSRIFDHGRHLIACLRPAIPYCLTEWDAVYAAATDQFHLPAESVGEEGSPLNRIRIVPVKPPRYGSTGHFEQHMRRLKSNQVCGCGISAC